MLMTKVNVNATNSANMTKTINSLLTLVLIIKKNNSANLVKNDKQSKN